jgi:uncharacterized protein (DUF1501 family)
MKNKPFTSSDINLSRRDFLRQASLVSVAGSVAAPFALNLFAMNVAAASTFTSDYKALVCVYLGGGNDSANMVLATDAASIAGYTAARGLGGAASIAIPEANLAATTITPTTTQTGRSFALHPAMGPMKTLFDQGRAAVIANVGPLIIPVANRTAFQQLTTGNRPQQLFSHSNQTSQWQSTDPAQQIYGWGGRMADQVKDSNNPKQNFTCMSLSGNTVFLAGRTINQYQVNSNGTAVAIGGLTNIFGANGNSLRDIITPTSNNNLFEKGHVDVVTRSIAAQVDISNVIAQTTPTGVSPVAAPTQYTNPNTNLPASNSLAIQLQTVARLIAGRDILSAHRQVFFVSLGGFDTHDGQAPSHANLMARLAHAAKYFDDELSKSTFPGGPISNNVTLFTASDFGRTFTSNGDGTDHGWGAHHFVVGGAVNGGDIYGDFPVTAVNNQANPAGGTFVNDRDVGSGNLIPNISVDQYAGTMANWFGLNTTELATVFPNLNNFSSTTLGTNIGFMKP